MYYLCNKCSRIIRDNNVEKHEKKCQGATFSCCDCNEEFDVHTIGTHTVCPNALKSILPAVYNPKAVQLKKVTLIFRKYNVPPSIL